MIKDLITAIKLPFLKDKELYCDIKRILGFYPGDIELYKTALMHKSVMHRNNKGKPVNNERLEFLGDAVLDAVVGDIVYRHFPGKREGFLTNTRSKLVQRETLGKLANEMGITKLVLSSGRSQSHNSYLGGNAFEALVGAMYLDKGYDTCMKFMEKRILDKLINIDKVAYKEVNFKSKLLEWSQKNRINLEYKEVESKKDEHGNPVFIYKVVLEGIDGDTGKGYSKKESQQMASKLTLERLRKNTKYLDSIFAAKTDRTKMEEEPVMCVPEVEPSNETPAPKQPNKNKPENKPEKKAEKKQENKVEKKPVEKSEQKEAKPAKKDDKPVNKENKADNNAEESPKENAPSEERKPRRNNRRPRREKPQQTDAPTEQNDGNKPQNDDKDFDLSDISAKQLTREEIIELAEKAAFEEQ